MSAPPQSLDFEQPQRGQIHGEGGGWGGGGDASDVSDGSSSSVLDAGLAERLADRDLGPLRDRDRLRLIGLIGVRGVLLRDRVLLRVVILLRDRVLLRDRDLLGDGVRQGLLHDRLQFMHG